MSQTSKELWLLRHGEAEPHGVRADFERQLTEKGRSQAVAAGGAFKRLAVDFGLVLSSPRVRALETAKLACKQIDRKPVTHERLSAGFDSGEAFALLAGQEYGSKLLVVGHEPTFSQVVYDLSGARIEMRKGGVAVVQIESSGNNKLVALLRPAELAAIAAAS